jgi:hypothetical protein
MGELAFVFSVSCCFAEQKGHCGKGAGGKAYEEAAGSCCAFCCEIFFGGVARSVIINARAGVNPNCCSAEQTDDVNFSHDFFDLKYIFLIICVLL